MCITPKGAIMIKKRILLSLLTLTMGSTLILANAVYATGNPAESHDETSPLRRVQDMQYGDTHISFNTSSYNIANAGEGCSECQKQRDVVQLDNKHVKDVHHYRHHKKHHHKHIQREHLKHEK